MAIGQPQLGEIAAMANVLSSPPGTLRTSWVLGLGWGALVVCLFVGSTGMGSSVEPIGQLR